jgi:hypothetical protein
LASPQTKHPEYLAISLMAMNLSPVGGDVKAVGRGGLVPVL